LATVAERAFVAERLARVNVAFDDEVGAGQNGFQFLATCFHAPPTRLKRPEETLLTPVPLSRKLADDEPGAKPILSGPRGAKKQIPISFLTESTRA
jgi:hypothetical protein